eukprot:401407-Pyramimonas_sp.AAC.1
MLYAAAGSICSSVWNICTVEHTSQSPRKDCTLPYSREGGLMWVAPARTPSGYNAAATTTGGIRAPCYPMTTGFPRPGHRPCGALHVRL